MSKFKNEQFDFSQHLFGNCKECLYGILKEDNLNCNTCVNGGNFTGKSDLVNGLLQLLETTDLEVIAVNSELVSKTRHYKNWLKESDNEARLLNNKVDNLQFNLTKCKIELSEAEIKRIKTKIDTLDEVSDLKLKNSWLECDLKCAERTAKMWERLFFSKGGK